MTQPTVLVSARSLVRRKAARDWLTGNSGLAEALVVGESLTAPHDLILSALDTGAQDRDSVRSGGRGGWRRTTLSLLASELAAAELHGRGLTPGGALARDAIVERTLMRIDPTRLGRLAAVADTPGFGRAVGSALDDLRMAAVPPDQLEGLDSALAELAREVTAEWAAAGLADRAGVLEAATQALGDPGFAHHLVDTPTLLLDVRISNRREADFVSALLERAPDTMVTVPAGDTSTLRAYQLLRFVIIEKGRGGEGAIGPAVKEDPADRALHRLQDHLFETPPAPGESDDSLTVFSAPGESRECVEIARRLMTRAGQGKGFDGAAILLRQPDDYRPYLEEALGRASIPAYFARGVRRPDPAGRAFRALLLCREEAYSALRFAEYLSIGEVPDGEAAGLESGSGQAVRARTLRVPRRWEKLLVEASVVGGRERWTRRLAGLRAELELKREGIDSEDVDDPRLARVDRSLEDLEYFREYALPLLDALDALPESASWGVWLDRLGALATRAIRHPHTVLSTLAELAPMAPIGPVTLTEVVRTLGPRLVEMSAPPSGNRYGKVFVGPIEAARGLSFDVVFIPGMAERVFPPKIAEDPILLDRVRDGLNTPGESEAAGLITNTGRVVAERLALKLAVGAAREQVVLSYPRIEAVKSRPRVPSFYMLEAVRAAEGELPSFEDLAKRAEDVSEARIGWPAPQEAARAIDEAEYDLAVLADLGVRGDQAVKAAGHLLHTNTHLARALRFRAYRWEVPRWTWADGLVDLSPGAAAALAEEAPDVRPFSATALQNFAACPYRFYLYAIQRLSPREEPIGIEALDPLQRGSLVHQVQFELLTRLQKENDESAREGGPSRLPVRPDNVDHALSTLDSVLDKVAGDFEDRLVPAIERVWIDGVESIRQDLREWLHRQSLDLSPFEPYRFELSFGLPPDADRDEHSVPDPVDLGVGLKLRGAIDLVERTPEGVMRVTDHKTGRYRAKRNAVIQGGELLQPVLYGLAVQQLFPGDDVQSGRLYYCTADGEYRAHEVPINEHTTEGARVLSDVLAQAYRAGAFQALPRAGACDWCDYRTVCGPDEERRVRRKPAPVELKRLRDFQ